MKEKKIIQSVTTLQEVVFKYKKYVKSLPDNITKKQRDKLFNESIKVLVENFSVVTEILYLGKSPGKEPPIGLRELDKMVTEFKTLIRISDKMEDGGTYDGL